MSSISPRLGLVPWVHAVAVCLLCLPIVALFAHSQIIIPLGVLALLGAGLALFVPGARVPLPGRPSILLSLAAPLVVVFIAWVWVGLIWTPRFDEGLRAALSMIAVGLGGWGLFICLEATRRAGRLGWVMGILFVGVVAVAAIVACEALTDGVVLAVVRPELVSLEDRVSSLNSGVSMSFLMAWPLGLMALSRGKGLFTLCLALIVLVMVGLSNSESAKAALMIGFVASALAWVLGGFAVRMVFWTYALVVATTPFVFGRLLTESLFRQVGEMLPFSLQHRFIMWQHVSGFVFEKPWFGWGVSSSRSFEDLSISREFYRGAELGWMERTVQIMPIHPHNAGLQVWLDLGLVGVVLVVLLLVLSGEGLARSMGAGPTRSRGENAVVTGATAAGLTLTLGTYSMWQGWLMTFGVFLACLIWVVRLDRGGVKGEP